jgi:hypothetical protein
VSTGAEIELAAALENVVLRMICARSDAGLASMMRADPSVPQPRCPVALAAEDREMPIHTLAERLDLTLATAGRTVERLVAQGLVTRRPLAAPHAAAPLTALPPIGDSAKNLTAVPHLEEQPA